MQHIARWAAVERIRLEPAVKCGCPDLISRTVMEVQRVRPANVGITVMSTATILVAVSMPSSVAT